MEKSLERATRSVLSAGNPCRHTHAQALGCVSLPSPFPLQPLISLCVFFYLFGTQMSLLRTSSYLQSMALARGQARTGDAVTDDAPSPARQVSSTPMKQQAVSFSDFAPSPVNGESIDAIPQMSDDGSSNAGTDDEAGQGSPSTWWGWLDQVRLVYLAR